MRKNIYPGKKIPKIQINKRCKLVNMTYHTQAVDINNSLICINPYSSIVIRAGDILCYNKNTLNIVAYPTRFTKISSIILFDDNHLEFLSSMRKPKKRPIKYIYDKAKYNVESFIKKIWEWRENGNY